MGSFVTWLFSSPPAAWLQALGTPTIGIAATYIAWRGARTARNKLKFDMFERRLQVYRELTALISEAMMAGWFSYSSMETYRQLQAQSRFLFSDAAIDTYLEDVRAHLYNLIPLEFGLENEETIDETKMVRRGLVIEWEYHIGSTSLSREEIIENNPWLHSASWLRKHNTKIDELTLPYLRVTH